MKKQYSKPLVEVEKYEMIYDIFTVSFDDNSGNLHDDDEFKYFGDN